MFELHPQLESDSVALGRLHLSRLRLLNDSRFPWLVLVPAVAGVRELYQLEPPDRRRLMDEIVLASDVLRVVFHPDKLNVGALGNIVPQLHVHVIARFRADSAWPGPVWSSGAPDPYAADTLAATCDRLRGVFAGYSDFRPEEEST